MEPLKLIGTIYSVSSNSVSAILRDSASQSQSLSSAHDGIGKLGSYVIMKGGERPVIGSIMAVRTIDSALTEGSKLTDRISRQIMDIQLLGTMKGGKFERGVSSFPVVGGSVYAAESNDLKTIFSTYREHDFSVGAISLMEHERLFLDPNKFFAKHIALFGSTG
ncbi:MAG: hypothetical protein HY707_06010, partial [Ignavibacteriae bacterium]|nr:hypothetical protein [Ignavibacteriota bacterium]